MKKLFKAFIIFTLSFTSLAQEVKDYRYVPFFKSLSIPALSNQLTKGIESDEQKVKAIYTWVTNNIKYDVDQWLGFNSQRSTTRHTLFRRKGSAPDFSYLFNELCRYASIPSVIVSGYLKNEYTDYGHSYLSDDHSWNAVYINNEWKLYDVCLDAGKIEYYKRTFAGYFIYGFTLGASDRLVYKPHFKRDAQLNYFAKNGFSFKKDHAPSYPIWQLIEPKFTLKEFEKDSAYVLNKIKISEFRVDTTLNEIRWNYFQKNEVEKDIELGKSAFEYNPQNNFRKAKSEFLSAQLLTDRIYKEDATDSIIKANLSEIEKSNQFLSSAITLLDSNAVNLKNQKKILIDQSKLKKELVKQQNKTLLKSTNLKQKTFNSVPNISISVQITGKSLQRNNKKIKKKILGDKSYQNTIASKSTSVNDSIVNMQSVLQTLDSITVFKESMLHHINALNLLNKSISSNFEIIKDNTTNNIKTEKVICDLRLDFFDDLDIEIRTLKDTLFQNKIKVDSLLIDPISSTILNAFYKQFSTLKSDLTKISAFENNFIKQISKVKKATQHSEKLDTLYSNEIDRFKKFTKSIDDSIVRLKKEFKSISKEAKTFEEIVKEEKHLYTKEWYIENQLSSIRSFFISKYIKNQTNRSKKLQKEAAKLMKQNLKIVK